jgi:hypothetical protein
MQVPHLEAKFDHNLRPWLARAHAGDVFLTSNTRAARWLQRRIAQQAHAAGVTSWATPRVLPWSAWVSTSWQQLAWSSSVPVVLLNSWQEQQLWEQTIAEMSDASPLNLAALAGLASRAWQLLHSHGEGPATLRQFSASFSTSRPDWQAFRRWADHFAKRLNERGMVTHAQLEGELLRGLASGTRLPPQRLVLWGFDETTPMQERLLAAIASTAVPIVDRVWPAATATAAPGKTFAAQTQAEEFAAAAAWAHSRLQQQPDALLAIITTNAKGDRGALTRALGATLAPSQFSFSLGWPLAQLPLVRTALRLLRWACGPLEPAEISDLLVSPAIARDRQQVNERAAFDMQFFRRRANADPLMTLRDFHAWLLAQFGRMHAPPGAAMQQLARQCEAAAKVLPRNAPAMAAQDWATRFTALLAAFGFPSALCTSAEEFLTHKSFLDLLAEFATLGLRGWSRWRWPPSTSRRVLPKVLRLWGRLRRPVPCSMASFLRDAQRIAGRSPLRPARCFPPSCSGHAQCRVQCAEQPWRRRRPSLRACCTPLARPCSAGLRARARMRCGLLRCWQMRHGSPLFNKTHLAGPAGRVRIPLRSLSLTPMTMPRPGPRPGPP